MHTEQRYTYPYMNHYGWGCSMGCGNENGSGTAFTTLRKQDNWNGSSIGTFNGHKTYFVNGYVLYITHIHGPWAMGEIIHNDLTTQKCYLTKVNDKFAVGGNLRAVLEEMREKITESTSAKKNIAKAFILVHPEYEKEYDWDEMVAWHSLDKTSCVDGRRRFSLNSNKKSGDLATPKELIQHMKESPAREIAIEMERLYINK